MKKYLILVAIAIGLSLALAACGGGAPSTSLSVDMVEFMYNPTNFTVPSGPGNHA
jgi:ABC-type glycerol-3-phosphate transport system substrate-binding protein